nr:hypothetical protein [Ralstonia sp. ASV6]
MRDPVSDGLKLGSVDETGVGYYDIHAAGELPKPIHGELDPRSLGTVTSWFSALDPEFAKGLSEAWRELTARNLDALTIARALRAGIEQQIYDPDLLEQAGQQATQRILDGRARVAEMASGD